MYVSPLFSNKLAHSYYANYANCCVIVETHLTDNEIERIKKANEEEERKKMHVVARKNAQERINVRKAER